MPAYIWDGESLPVPVEDIVDSIYGLRVRLVEDLSSAPGAPDTDARADRVDAVLPRDHRHL